MKPNVRRPRQNYLLTGIKLIPGTTIRKVVLVYTDVLRWFGTLTKRVSRLLTLKQYVEEVVSISFNIALKYIE